MIGYVTIQGYILKENLTASEMLICGLVDGYMKKDGSCDLSNESLGKILRMTKDQVARHISNLYAKDALRATGTKKKRKLRLNYTEDIVPNLGKMENEDDVSARFETLWAKEPSAKKDAKAEAKKYFLKLSTKQMALVESARTQYLTELADVTFATILRTFIKQKQYEDEKYHTVPKSAEQIKEETEFDLFLRKVMAVSKQAETSESFKKLGFDAIKSENEPYFSQKEVGCLENAVGDMDGLIDQAYEEGNLKALLKGHW